MQEFSTQFIEICETMGRFPFIQGFRVAHAQDTDQLEVWDFSDAPLPQSEWGPAHKKSFELAIPNIKHILRDEVETFCNNLRLKTEYMGGI